VRLKVCVVSTQLCAASFDDRCMGILSWWTLGTDLLGELVSPSLCAACDVSISMHTVFCGACAGTVERVEPTESGPFAAFAYGGALAQAIQRCKYEKRPDLARPLASLLRSGLGSLVGSPPDLVIPVPLHPSRLVDRGYNQAALLASHVARGFGSRFAPRTLERVRATTPQASLDQRGRQGNVAGAFALRAGSQVSGAYVLLIDDVSTTGATLGVCAEVLRAAGVRRVESAVVAIALDRRAPPMDAGSSGVGGE
jgi:ComF family protein